MDIQNAYNKFRDQESLLQNIQALTFKDLVATGTNRLVSIDLRTAKMYVRNEPDLEPFCCINLPDGSAAINTAVESRKLKPVFYS